MNPFAKAAQSLYMELRRARPGLVPLFTFTVLLGLLNLLVVNQKVVLYLFYLPVIFAAWALPKRDAVALAILASLLVVSYVLFLPRTFSYDQNSLMIWMEIVIWSGILIITAYLVSTLRLWTQEAMANLQQAYSGVLSILTKFIQTVDADTEAHSVRVAAWAVRIANELGLKRGPTEELRIAAMLHDVGKIDVSVKLLRKAAALSGDEREEIDKHTMQGAAIIKPIGGMLVRIADTVEAHHEKYDGSGHRGLKAEEIPLASRIIAVADVFDALLSDRPYRKGMPLDEALQGIVSSAESHFDPRIVVALQTIVNREGDRALSEAIGLASQVSSGTPDATSMFS